MCQRIQETTERTIMGMSFGTIFVYSDDISEFVFDRDEENSDQLDFEASSDFEDEIEDDIDSNTDLY